MLFSRKIVCAPGNSKQDSTGTLGTGVPVVKIRNPLKIIGLRKLGYDKIMASVPVGDATSFQLLKNSGRGQPHSTTLTRLIGPLTAAPAFGVRTASAAFFLARKVSPSLGSGGFSIRAFAALPHGSGNWDYMASKSGKFAYDNAVRSQFILAIILLVLFALTRWPGIFPQNFSAVYALVFCGGLFLRGKTGWYLPLAILLVTDLCLNVLFYGVSPLHVSMVTNYLVYAAILWIAHRFKPSSNFFLLLLGSLSGAILFYIVTNVGAWLQNPQYTKNLAGLIQALTLGTAGWPTTLEFFRNTFLSTGLFTALFAVAMKLSEPDESKETEEAEEREPSAPGQEVEAPS